MDPLMLLVVIILLIWVVGALTPWRFGGDLIHVLIVVVLVLVIVRLVSGVFPR
jgi:Family of unknown function (DUF5670)